MNWYFKAIILLIFSGVDCTNDLEVEYYENLINEKIQKAEAYQFPERNLKFQAGAQSDVIHDFGNYDFIIVGAGAAGAVLATRLSEIQEWNILLLEAGGEENDFNTIPGMLWYIQFSDMNWGYYSTSQKNCCLGMIDNKCIFPRGKSIGGSTAINGLVYTRGNREDYDKWALLGNPGWSYEEVLPYFIKSENSQINGDLFYHGKGGLWNVEYPIPRSNTSYNFIEASVELNQHVVDYNGRNQLGVSDTQVNTKLGKRHSTGTAFLASARRRKNLKVVTEALVTKIDIDKNSKVAEGVLFVKNNKKFRATARKEVIVSGGAINSPQLLMLSGIGPEDHLKEMEIEVIEDLPVGKNLMEHPWFTALIFHTNSTFPANNTDELIGQYLEGVGPLTHPSNFEGIGFIRVDGLTAGAPMVEYTLIPSNSTPSIQNRVVNFNDELTNNYLSKVNPTTDISIQLYLLHPKSRGQITLKSNDSIDFPNIDLNLFDKSEDIDNAIKGIEFILKLMQTKAFQKINATLIPIPICENFENGSYAFWECALRHMSMTTYHPCGTTAMGADKRYSVVDNKLRVHGTQRLRVVDAGVFPSTLSGHTNAPTVMVAEKIADDIKRDYSAFVNPPIA